MKLTKNQRLKFKVKLRSLAEESKIIRQYENGLFEREWKCTKPMPDKDKSLELWQGARCIVSYNCEEDRLALRNHRRGVVGFEYTATSLAYGYLRGLPRWAVAARRTDRRSGYLVKRAKEIIWSLIGKDVNLADFLEWYTVDKPLHVRAAEQAFKDATDRCRKANSDLAKARYARDMGAGHPVEHTISLCEMEVEASHANRHAELIALRTCLKACKAQSREMVAK